MDEEAAFLRAIQANPSDTTAKLAYADWLDERGEQEKAEYLRLVTSFTPLKRPTDAQARRSHELAHRLWTWTELLRDSTLVWDARTMFALGRLRGLLDTYATLSNHEVNLTHAFEASLCPRTSDVAEMATLMFGKDYSPVVVTPLANWETDLHRILDEWLFTELRHLSNGPRSDLAFPTESGRDGCVAIAMAHIRGVINPTAGWRIDITRGDRFYASYWIDIALEAADRVLFLHFSFSD
jgi:uncharacterized protein (TIGR02996 family)